MEESLNFVVKLNYKEYVQFLNMLYLHNQQPGLEQFKLYNPFTVY